MYERVTLSMMEYTVYMSKLCSANKTLHTGAESPTVQILIDVDARVDHASDERQHDLDLEWYDGGGHQAVADVHAQAHHEVVTLPAAR